MSAIKHLIDNTKLVVIKIGSALIVDSTTGKARSQWMGDLAADVASLRAAGTQVVLISSGSIALGRQHLELPAGAIKLRETGRCRYRTGRAGPALVNSPARA